MGCSNTTNNKKKNIKSENIKKEQASQVKSGDSGGTNDGKSNSDGGNNAQGKELGDKKEGELEIEDFKNIPYGTLRCSVRADTTEVMFPIWIEKGQNVKIHVRGRWGCIPEYGLVSYNGHSSFPYKHRNANIGALMGRIHGGKYFPIENEMTLISDVSGPIYLFTNNSRFSVTLSGSLEVFFENCQTYPLYTIESMLGWDLSTLDTTEGHDYMSPDEKQQIIYLNKIRSNPKLFAEQYLVHLNQLSESHKEIYQKLLRFPTSKLLKPSKALFLASKNHAKDIGENGITGHKSTDGADLRDRLSKYAENPRYFGENCSYGIKDPLGIVIQLVVDDGLQSRANRANILNEVYDQIGLSVQPHSSYKYTCVQVFGYNVKDLIDI
jgi:uncharacterized protein YkwD